MTLTVAFDQFADTLKRLGLSKEVFIAPADAKVVITAFHADKNFFVATESSLSIEQVEADLKQMGLTVFQGVWKEGAPTDVDKEAQYIAAVAYKAKNHQVGVWLDAYPYQPTQAQVLHAIYDEFKQHGEIGDLGFEAFVRLANPTVVIASHAEMLNFVGKHTGKS